MTRDTLIPNASSQFYVAGGTLRHDTPSYVERRADAELFEALQRGEFCYVLTSRQMGKSSLMVRTAARLREEGAQVAILDLTAIGQNLSPEQWYGGLLRRLGRQLDPSGDLEETLEDYWFEEDRRGPLDRWMAALEQVVLPRLSVKRQTSSVETASRSVGREAPGDETDPLSAPRSTLNTSGASRLVIFVDEIDAVRSLPFSADEFFAAIRECYNRRTEDAAFHRLTFCLLGVATPSELIQDTRMTPFNIGRRIDLTDFSASEAAPLALGLGGKERSGEVLLQRVLVWTGGHPYLTQRLCQAVAEDPSVLSPAGVDRHCDALFLSAAARERDDNLLFVRERLLKGEVDLASLLDLYGTVRAGKPVRPDDTNPLLDLLRLSGIARLSGNQLVVRNRIYDRVFDRDWVTQHMPDAELRRQRAAYRRGLLRASSIAAAVMLVMASLTGIAFTERARAENATHRAQSSERLAKERAETLQKQAHQLQALTISLRAALQQVRQEGHRANGERDRAVAAQRNERTQRLRADRAFHAAQAAQREAETNATLAQSQERRAEAARQKEQQAARHARELLARAQMDRGVRLLEAGDTRGLLDLLQAHRTAAALPTLRRSIASLWASWQSLSDGRLVSVIGPSDRVQDLAISPDGKQFATGTADGTARLWDLATGRPQSPPLRHGGPVLAVAFSPDGRLLASGSLDRTSRLWATADGKPRGLPMAHDEAVRHVRFSPDGRLLATVAAVEDAQAGGLVRSWYVGTGAPAGPALPLAGGNWLRWPPESRVFFTPDGKLLALGRDALGVGLREMATGKSYGGCMPTNSLNTVLSTDGKLLATGWIEGAQVWHVGTGDACGPPLPVRGFVRGVALSPNGKLLATGSSDGSVQLWVSANGKRYGPPLWHTASVTRVMFSPDGSLLATFTGDGSIRVWRVQAPRLPDYVSYASLRYPQSAAAAFSADGTLLATVSTREGPWTVRLWKTATGVPYGQPLRCHGPVNRLELSADGKLLAVVSTDQTLQLWDTATGRPHGPPLQGRQPSFSPDGKLLLTRVGADTLRLWDTATGRPRGQPLQHRGNIWKAAFSRDGSLVAVATEQNTAYLWETGTGRLRCPPLSHPGMVSDVAFSPDSRLLLTSTPVKGMVRSWDTRTGRLLSPLVRDPDGVWSLAVSRDGRRVATGSETGVARVWDAATGQLRGRFVTQGVRLDHVAFSADDRRLITSPRFGPQQMWDVATGLPAGSPLPWDPEGSWLPSPNGERSAIRRKDGTLRLERRAPAPTTSREMALRTAAVLGVEPGAQGAAQPIPRRKWYQLLQEPLPGSQRRAAATVVEPRERGRAAPAAVLSVLWGHTDQVPSVAFSPDGTLLATAGADGLLRLWDVASQQPRRTLAGLRGPVLRITFSPDGRRLLAVGDGTVRLWNPITGQEQARFPTRAVTCAAFSPDGKTLATGSLDGALTLWEVDTIREMVSRQASPRPLLGLHVASDGKTLLTRSAGDAIIRLWDRESLQPRGTLPAGGDTFASGGHRVATLTAWGTVTVWDAATGQAEATLHGHSRRITDLAFSADGKQIATASTDGTVRWWDAATGQLRERLRDGTADFLSVAFSPDGERLAAGTASGEVNLWHLGRAPLELARDDVRARHPQEPKP